MKNTFKLIQKLVSFKLDQNLILTEEDKKELDTIIQGVNEGITTDKIEKLSKNLTKIFELEDLLKLIHDISNNRQHLSDFLDKLGVKTDTQTSNNVSEGSNITRIKKSDFRWF